MPIMKTKTNKIPTTIIYFLIVLCGFCYFNSAAQTTDDSNWVSAKDTLGITISYKLMACNGRNWLFLKVTNSASKAISLKWDDVMVSGSVKYSSTSKPNFNGTINLAANQTKEGNCATPYGNDRTLSLPFKSYIGDVPLSEVSYSVLNLSFK